uniref:Putative secreted protein n=1 Tax=Ixodes scapularis TaxID=6945 RepID=A0A4D5RYR8_IXOSC
MYPDPFSPLALACLFVLQLVFHVLGLHFCSWFSFRHLYLVQLLAYAETAYCCASPVHFPLLYVSSLRACSTSVSLI